MKNARKPSAMPAQPMRFAVMLMRPPPPFAAAPRSRIRYTTSTSVETNSTTKPWIMQVRFEASAGSKTVGSRLRIDVPVISPPNSSAAEQRADRRVAPEQRDRDPGEPERC